MKPYKISPKSEAESDTHNKEWKQHEKNREKIMKTLCLKVSWFSEEVNYHVPFWQLARKIRLRKMFFFFFLQFDGDGN